MVGVAGAVVDDDVDDSEVVVDVVVDNSEVLDVVVDDSEVLVDVVVDCDNNCGGTKSSMFQ